MSAVTDVLFFVSVFREFGIPVDFEPGWETRGNGQTAAYQGCLVHHTATPASYANPMPTTRILRDGRSDLSGPLCQFQGGYNGRVRVIAANPANHAGASGGRSMGPLPTTGAFNRLVMGLEMDYSGVAPMSDEQYKIALVYMIACKRLYGSVERARAHFETSIEGKIDPAWAANPVRMYDMNKMRADALGLEGTGSVGGDEEMSAAGEKTIIDLLQQVLKQLTGSPVSGQFPGWELWAYNMPADAPKAATLVDILRAIHAKLLSNYDTSQRPAADAPDDVVGHALSSHKLLVDLTELVSSLGGGTTVELTPAQAETLSEHTGAIVATRLDELAAELGVTVPKLVDSMRIVLQGAHLELPSVPPQGT